MRLEGKTALITGGSQGIGAAIAEEMAAEGAQVVIADIRDQEGQAVAEHISQERAGKSLFVHLDVTDEQQWDNAVREAVSKFGHLDILVNNAGIGSEASIADESLATWEKTMAVNSTGVFLGTKAAINAMRDSGGGSIVNMSSIYGLVGSDWAAAYHASKGSVRLLTKAAAVAHAKEGIRVNSVHPGFIWTDLTAELLSSDRGKQIIAKHPMGRAGKPEEVAKVCVFLASDEASFVTGGEFAVDGGYVAQ